MTRQYKIVSDTTTVLVEDVITKLSEMHKKFEVHGGVTWDGTNFCVLVSFEV